LVRALAKVGFEHDRTKGSHMVLREVAPPYRRLVVPDHREIAKGTLRAILRQAGLDREDLVRLLDD
jgi:predicted RNA binding protein YcfA (HicA-like mRNA interferase family)